MPNEKLKPCPFCGGECTILECVHYHNGPNGRYTKSGGFYAQCDKCVYDFGHNQDHDEYGDSTTIYDTKEELIVSWNRRA